MKDVLRAAGVPCARHRLAGSAADAWAFVDEVGFPLVVKPPAGFGARGTYRLDEPDALRGWLAAAAPAPADPALLEEFLVGEEHSFDSITVDGELRWYSVSDYLPTPLEVLRNPWMEWAVLLPREIDGPQHAGIREAGPAALRALGLRTGLTHLVWYRKADGEVVFGEIGARPPGARTVDVMNYVTDGDLFVGWAAAVVHGRLSATLERRYNAASIFKRARGQGRITAVEGLSRLLAEYGEHVVALDLAAPGTPRRDWRASVTGDGIIIVRHRDLATTLEMADRFAAELHLHAA